MLDTLRTLIGDYPAGIGVVKELLQNADDAGATWLRVVFDRRTHHGSDVPSTLTQLMGPALLVESNQTFTDANLAAIRKIGAGSKLLDVERTGQFGRGFNTTYAVTDYPAFVTRNLLCCFDPFDDVVSQHDGDHGTEWWLRDLWTSCPTWLRAFGLPDGVQTLENTIFRLPLRTASQARAGRLSDRPFAPDDVPALLREVEELYGTALLLFLRHVRHLDIWEISTDGAHHPILSMRTTNEDEVERARSSLRLAGGVEVEQYLKDWRRDPSAAPHAVYTHEFEVSGRCVRREGWLVSQSFEPGTLGFQLDRAQEMLEIKRKAVPKVGVACKLAARGAPVRVEGRLFCTLPLPIQSGLPFHVNGFFDLDSSRRALTQDSGAPDVRIRSAWNEALLLNAVPSCAGALFRYLLSQSTAPDAAALYGIWPSPIDESQRLLAGLTRGVIRELAEQPSIRVRGAGAARWVRPNEATRPRSDWSTHFVDALRGDGLELVEPALPEGVLSGLADVRCKPEPATPAQVCAILRHVGTIAVPHAQAPLGCLRDRQGILCLVDLFKQFPTTELEGLPLSLRADGQLRTLASNVKMLDADAEVRQLARCPEWFLDVEVIKAFSGNAKVPGLSRIEAGQFCQVLRWLHDSCKAAGLSPWTSAPGGVVDLEWLERVVTFLARHPPPMSQQALGGLPLVVDLDGTLRTLYAEDSPCRPNPKLTPVQIGALRALGVPMTGTSRSLLAALDYLLTQLPGSPLPTLAEAIARRLLAWPESTAVHESWGTLIDLLAEAHGERPLAAETLQRLANARIWPTAGGTRAVSDAQVYVPAGFQAPSFADDVHLLALGDGHARQPLLKAMGAREYTLDQFIRRTFLQRFGSLDDGTRHAALIWLADSTRRDYLAGADELRKDLRRAPIAPTTGGTWVAPNQIYHPEATDAHSLLAERGPALRCPATPIDKPWQDLFVTLGMVRVPRLRQVLQRVADLARAGLQGGGPHILDAIHGCFAHVVGLGKAGWERDVDGRSVSQHLAELSWLPALRGNEASARYGVVLDAEERLFKPAELFRAADGFLVASQEPLCACSNDHGLLEALGVRAMVPLATARAHFKAVRDAYQAERVGAVAARHTAQGFYAYLGRSMAEVTTAATTGARQAFGATEVIWDDEAERFWQADHCFAQPVPYFLSLRAHIPGDGTIGAGMDLLGRRPNAETRDFVGYLDDLATSTRGRPLTEDEQASALHVLMQPLLRLRTELAAPGMAWHGLGRVHVLDEKGLLRRAMEVLKEDAPWWADRLDRDVVALLHERVGEELARFAGVHGVSTTIREELVERMPAAADSGSAMVCHAFTQRLRSVAFEVGLRRLILGEHQNLEPGLEGVLGLQFEACAALSTELAGAPLAPQQRFGHENVEVYLVDELMYIAGGSSDNVIPDVALAVNRRLGPCALRNLAPLEEILRVPVSEIAARLDRRRIPPLPDAVVPPTRSEWSHNNRDSHQPTPTVTAEDQPATTTEEVDATGSETSVRSNGSSRNGTSSGGPPPFGSRPRDPARSHTGSGASTSDAPPGEAPTTPSIRPRDGRARLLVPRRGRRLISYLKAPTGHIDGTTMSSDATSEAVDAAALGKAREYEAMSGISSSLLKETPDGHPGFDLARLRQDGEPERVIEVKGLIGAWDGRGVGLRPAQARAAWDLDDRYWVYVVEHATDPVRARVHAIHNPIKRTTSFQLDGGWRVCAERVPEGTLLPGVGRHIYLRGSYLGIIESVSGNFTDADGIVVLSVRGDNGELRDRTWSPSRHSIEMERR
ncbi:MAG: DUF3883 domain-containing protein [Pseudomonadota bacterium]|nr:DUF3883 domain-containing protein [Pseudomonadota bacterium]